MSEVVVGVDGSPESATALEWAAAAATQRGSLLRIIYALHMPLAAVPFDRAVPLPPSDDLRDRAEALLTAAQEHAENHAPGVRVNTELSLRPASHTLLAASRHADLVVVGTRGLGVFGSAFLGSVSVRVAARASCPTIVVREGSAPPDAEGPVLVGFDGSTHSAAAVRFALREARLRDVAMIALTAYQRPDPILVLEDPELVHRLEEDARREATRLVTDIIEREQDEYTSSVKVETRVVAGHAPAALVDAGQEASLTVVGSRGRGGFRGMLLGSVGQYLLHRASQPVAVVHAPDDED